MTRMKIADHEEPHAAGHDHLFASAAQSSDLMVVDSLETNTVLVRWLSLSAANPAHWSSWRRILDRGERRQADKFRFAVDREAFTAAHALRRVMLSELTGNPTAAWRYTEGEFGRPELAPCCATPTLRFNISHTRGLVACAIAHHQVGVDVESADRAIDFGLADTVFAPEEALILKSASPNQIGRLFFRFWTLKEAFIKATGEGLSRPLNSFSFTLDPVRIQFHPERNRASPHDDPAAWQFAEYRPSKNKYLALAVRRAPSQKMRLDARAVRPEEIVPTI
jgi:4'-phosphopantetheinyl transferase